MKTAIFADGRVIVLALVSSFYLSTTPLAATSTANTVADRLDALKDKIAEELTDSLKTNRLTGSYTTVWRQFEETAIGALKEILPKHITELTSTNFDGGTPGREKNRLADLAIVIGGERIEVSIKSAQRSANPENDMGTFRDHPNRRKLFAGSFTLWVRYEESGDAIHCDRVFLTGPGVSPENHHW